MNCAANLAVKRAAICRAWWTCVALLAFPFMPGVAAAQAVPNGFATSADVIVRVYVPKGRLRIATWMRDSIAVRGTIGANARFFGGGDRRHVKLGVEPVTVTDPTLPSADWELTVPRGTRLWVKMIDGDLAVSGTSTECELYAVQGRIVVRDVAGVTSIESIDASVEMSGARGDVRVRGSKGTVALDRVEGTVSVATVSGAVSLTRFRAEGRVETIGGQVTYRGGALPGTQLDVQTHGGAVQLQLEGPAIPELDLESRTGKIDDASKVAARRPTPTPPTRAPTTGRIAVRSFKGNITVHHTVAPGTDPKTHNPKP